MRHREAGWWERQREGPSSRKKSAKGFTLQSTFTASPLVTGLSPFLTPCTQMLAAPLLGSY